MDNWQFHMLLVTRALNRIYDQIPTFNGPT
ncbi:hypothetical protein Goshw_029087 [Gossypium schwendimanii]|uniref:Uncharacterized protein n=3 Tax=Gossypium TaxID=3633 RepID=A0A7J9KZK8_GOSSC|nr:hypothetical protein [Gossypium davidsonii]MBA0644118.1 hypothetical protein [Gossypium klotzschianum]MBA0851922.1 hypothetical protein [Gossypium schwendimanii]